MAVTVKRIVLWRKEIRIRPEFLLTLLRHLPTPARTSMW